VPPVRDERPPNSNPLDGTEPWGHAKFLYVAKEFTGLFVNHCHILGHEDRGMMQNTQSACADGNWGVTGPVAVGAKCDDQGFCPGDCVSGQAIPATDRCPEPPAQMSDWPAAYRYPNPEQARYSKRRTPQYPLMIGVCSTCVARRLSSNGRYPPLPQLPCAKHQTLMWPCPNRS
jgi:hypothetical protein